jgi:hypothetical protein
MRKYSKRTSVDVDVNDINAWVTEHGGEVIPTLGSYEITRFRGAGVCHVIYAGKKGISFSSNDAKMIYRAYKRNEDVRLADKGVVQTRAARMRIAEVIRRDGAICFFCLGAFSDDDPATIEHVVPRAHGGPNHMSNYVVAHLSCNRDAGILSASEKYKIREGAIMKGYHVVKKRA